MHPHVPMKTPIRFVLPALLLAASAPTLAQDAAFARCLAAMQPQAAARGIDAASFARYTADLQPDRTVLPLLDAQPEFTTPIWDYLAGLVDEQRVADGRAMLAAHRELLARLQAQYGVDPEAVVAVWGVESDYGRVTGKRPLRVSLATLACEGRRQDFFRGEFLALLSLLHSGDLADPQLTGSWAGAFGQTQFIPSTYARIAVDGDGDGRRDLVGSIPDALASTANYLGARRLDAGATQGYEVKLPRNFDTSRAGRKGKRPLAEWVAAGIVRVDGGAIAPSQAPAALLLPAGAGAGLHRLRQLRRDLRLQRRRELRAGHRHAGRPPARRRRHRHGLSRPTIPGCRASSARNCRRCCWRAATPSVRPTAWSAPPPVRPSPPSRRGWACSRSMAAPASASSMHCAAQAGRRCCRRAPRSRCPPRILRCCNRPHPSPPRH